MLPHLPSLKQAARPDCSRIRLFLDDDPCDAFLKQDIEQEEEFLAQEMSHVPHKVRPS